MNPRDAIIILVTLLAALCLALAATFAHAAGVPCAPVADTLRGLYADYGEYPAFVAEGPGGVTVITLNPDTGTWSMLVQPNSDVICMMATGRHWTAAPDSLKPKRGVPM